MTSLGPQARGRIVGAVTTAAGAVALTAPHGLSRVASGSSSASPPTWIVRVLGARYLAQAAAELARPSPTTWLASSAADSLHAATMVVAAFTWPSYRRVAVVSGAVAVFSAMATASVARGR